MIKTAFNNIAITGIACCVPENKDDFSEYKKSLGVEVVDKFSQNTGVASRHIALREQTASDLAYIAACKLLTEKGIDAKDLGALVFVSQTSDYRLPATAFVLQKRLGLSQDCICFDINLGCSSYVYGLSVLSAIMSNSNIQKGVLLCADTVSKYVSPEDRSVCMLLADAGSATLMEKREGAPSLTMAFRADGNHFKSVMIPAGACRNMDAPHERTLWGDENTRSDYDVYMNGTDVFGFTIRDVPMLIKEFMAEQGTIPEQYDALILHQANAYVLKQVAKRVNFPMEKVPISIDRYGNTSGTSVPVTIVDAYGGHGTEVAKKLLLCAFGVGLSWAVAEADLQETLIIPMCFSNEYFTEGAKEHD